MTDLSSLSFPAQQEVKQIGLDATDASVTRVEQSTPNVALITYAPMIGKIITFVAGGFLLKWGIDVAAWTGDQWVQVLGPIVILGGTIWAWIGRKVAAYREHQIALASAASGVPMQPPASKV